MKIWIASDFQLDINRADPFTSEVEADVLVVAGDAHPPLGRSLVRLASLAERLPVIYVPGNRDFYRLTGDPDLSEPDHCKDMESELERCRGLAERLGIRLLSNGATEIGGVRFIGATLWTDLRLLGSSSNDRLSPIDVAGINDFRLIHRTPGQYLTGTDYVELHARSRGYIEGTLDQLFDGPTVVVSHHAPHPTSISPRYEGSRRNGVFASDLSDILEGDRAPDIWIHGAMHHNVDYELGRTRVISNSRGYAGENPDYVSDYVIEVDTPAPAPVY